ARDRRPRAGSRSIPARSSSSSVGPSSSGAGSGSVQTLTPDGGTISRDECSQQGRAGRVPVRPARDRTQGRRMAGEGSVPVSDPFGARASLGTARPDFYRLAALDDGGLDLARTPFTLKVL